MVALIGGERFEHVWTPEFIAALEQRGTFAIGDHTGLWTEEATAAEVRRHEVAIVGWDTRGLPAGLASDPGRLRHICCYSGTVRLFVPRELVEAGLVVTNWGDLPAGPVAEAAMTHLLAALHQIPTATRVLGSGGWGLEVSLNGSLDGLAVGVYGMGVIGSRFVDMIRPFGPRLMAFDPYVEQLPDSVARAESLEELCEWSEALVIHAGLSDETNGSVTADHLARLPDHGIVVNTARGAIIDQEALFAEVSSGRLRAGLDVLEPDWLDADHPVRRAEHLSITFHQLDQLHWPQRPGLTPMQRRTLEHVDRHVAGAAPRFAFDLDRYDRSS